MNDERARRGAALVEALGLVRAQRRRARGRRRLVFASADDGAHWVILLDSTGRMGDKRITRAVGRFAACADGRWPADSIILPAATPTLAAAAGADVLMLRYGARSSIGSSINC